MVSPDSDKPAPRGVVEQTIKVLMDLISEIPQSDEPEIKTPKDRAKRLVLEASAKAALASGGLALPPGPLGMITVLPDLALIWKIQRQLVADIASVYGRSKKLGKEEMLYCLFKHATGQVLRDLVVRVGERVLIRRAPLGVIQRLLGRVGLVVTQQVAGRAISRWIPIAGAVGIGAYAFYDTTQVGNTAIKLFESELEPGQEVGVNTVAASVGRGLPARR